MFNLRLFGAGIFLFFLTACPAAPQTGTITAVQINSTLNTLASNNISNLTATVTGTGEFDATVNWSIVSGGGLLSSNTGASITYTAPNVTQNSNAVIRATAQADTSKQSETTITIKTAAQTNPIQTQAIAGATDTKLVTTNGEVLLNANGNTAATYDTDHTSAIAVVSDAKSFAWTAVAPAWFQTESQNPNATAQANTTQIGAYSTAIYLVFNFPSISHSNPVRLEKS